MIYTAGYGIIAEMSNSKGEDKNGPTDFSAERLGNT